MKPTPLRGTCIGGSFAFVASLELVVHCRVAARLMRQPLGGLSSHQVVTDATYVEQTKWPQIIGVSEPNPIGFRSESDHLVVQPDHVAAQLLHVQQSGITPCADVRSAAS